MKNARNQFMAKSNPLKQPQKTPAASRTDTEAETLEDPVATTLGDLHAALTAGRRMLGDPDAVLVYYVAVLAKDKVVAETKGTTHMSGLLADNRRADAAVSVNTMLEAAIVTPLVGKMQQHMEDALELESGSFPTPEAMRQTYAGGEQAVTQALTPVAEVEAVINGDADLEEN